MPVLKHSHQMRRENLKEIKRQHIRDAANEIFSRTGIEGVTIRSIATKAGYTPGAIYYYYANKNEILADILCESLKKLYLTVKKAADDVNDNNPAHHAINAFLNYYLEDPDKIYLMFLFFRGSSSSSLDLSVVRELNGRLIKVLKLIADKLSGNFGLPQIRANQRTIIVLANIIGLVLLHVNGHLNVLGSDTDSLLKDSLSDLTRSV